MKKFERTLAQGAQFNLKEEADKRLNLSAEEVENLSTEDIFDNIEVIETHLQVSEKELEGLLSNSNITSLEEIVKKCKDSLALHLNALKHEDVPEEIVFSGMTRLSTEADKVALIKPKEKVWFELSEGFNSAALNALVEDSPELVISILKKNLPKLTSVELRCNLTRLNNLEQEGLVVKKVEKSVVKSITTKQLSFEDLDNINE